MTERKGSDHTIAYGPKYAPRSNDGPMECTCGWQGLASLFAEHRRTRGLVSYHGRPRATEESPRFM